MIVKPFSQKIDPGRVFNVQNRQYSERLLMEDTVPANGTKIGKVAVSNLGHFFCMFITGHYTTLDLVEQVVVDNGIQYLAGQLVDGAGNRKLYNDYIPFDLWLSPGRRKDALVPTADLGNNLFYPIEFEYLFTANSDILLDVVNTSDNDNSYAICFHGIRIVSDMVVRNRIGTNGTLLTSQNQPSRRG